MKITGLSQQHKGIWLVIATAHHANTGKAADLSLYKPVLPFQESSFPPDIKLC